MTTAEMLRADGVREFGQFAEFRQWICETFVPLECVPADSGPFRGVVAHWELGDLRISRVSADAHLASRTQRMIAAKDQDYYKVGLLTAGSCQLGQQGRQVTLFPGDLAIYDCRRPYTMAFDDWFDMSFLMFPCQRLRLPPAAVDRVLATRVPGSESTGSLVASFLGSLVGNLEHSADGVNHRLADNVLDLLATLFGERTGGEPTDPCAVRQSLLLRVCAWIDANLSDPELVPETIARANHVSIRYLHRLFHDEGTSVARWVRERRLDNCRRDLEDPVHAARHVVAIARRWGFDDAAYFSKIFKASYGEPPGAYRMRWMHGGPMAGR
ncbi:MAG TPA: helix-turn-helix domain-containing protein [Streptosporangiaceae bacterium]|nr:helix-turn-helix domain-containing protein [Streptosporangiaceae bacterium]